MFSSDGWSHMIPKEIRIRGIGECVPFGHVVLYK
jgi:hypothetical protein